MADHRSWGAGFNGTGAGAGMGMHRRKHMMMHMTFYWGKTAEVLFTGWPGSNPKMYALSLVFVFVLAVLVECLSHCRFMKPGKTGVAIGFAQSILYTMRCGLSYLVMLAVMSFNGGVFIAGVGGMGVGFFLFGSRAFRNTAEKPTDIPPMACC